MPRLYVPPPIEKLFPSCPSYTVYLPTHLLASAPLVHICIISACYPLFMLSLKTHCVLFLAFRLFGMLSFYFSQLHFGVCSQRHFDVAVVTQHSCLDQVRREL